MQSDQAAAVFERHKRRAVLVARSYAAWRGLSPARRMDLEQEALIALWRLSSRVRPGASRKEECRYVQRRIEGAMLDFARRDASLVRHGFVTEDEFVLSMVHDHRGPSAPDLIDYEAMTRMLPTRIQHIFRLVFVEGASIREAGRLCGLSKTGVVRLVAAHLQSLRETRICREAAGRTRKHTA